MPRVIIFIESDDEEEGGGGSGQAGRALGKGAAIAGGGEALKLVKPEPVDDVAFRPLGLGALGPAVVPIPPRTENPRALSSPRPQSPRAPSPAPPGAAARPAGPPQPEIIDISEEREEDSGFRGAVPRPIIKGSGSAVRRVKDEPFDDFGSDWVPSPAAKRASVPGTSSAKRRRKSERPSTSRAKRDARGDNHALDGSSSASGAGRRAVGRPDEARSSKKRDYVKNRETDSRSAGGRSLSTKKALVPSEESRGAPGKARRGGSTRGGGRSRSALPASWSGTTVGSRIRSRSRQQGRVQYAAYPAQVPSEETEEDEDEDEEEVQKQEQTGGEDVEAMEVDDDEDSGAANEVAKSVSRKRMWREEAAARTAMAIVRMNTKKAKILLLLLIMRRRRRGERNCWRTKVTIKKTAIASTTPKKKMKMKMKNLTMSRNWMKQRRCSHSRLATLRQVAVSGQEPMAPESSGEGFLRGYICLKTQTRLLARVLKGGHDQSENARTRNCSDGELSVNLTILIFQTQHQILKRIL